MGYKKRTFTARDVAGPHRVYRGWFVGINGATPTSKVTPGITLARTGEGTWTLVPVEKCAGLVNATVTVEENDGAYHEVLVTSSAVSSGTLTVTVRHRQCAYADIATGPAAEDVIDRIHYTITVAESDVPGAGV
jgi:hypothetical protein